MALIKYLGHSGFSVETPTSVLIFDYSEGTIPEYDTDKQIYVFVSHHHPDHFNYKIFDLLSRYSNIHYFISYDIGKRITRFIQSNYTIVNANDDLHISNKLRIKALPSTDCGVGYLVCFEGKKYYHSGDLNLWLWDTMTEKETYQMVNTFREYTEGLKKFIIDVAFLPLDTRLGVYSFMGFDYYMKHFKIQKTVPMHFFGSSRITRQLIDSPVSQKYRNKIMPMEPGDTAEI